MGLHKLFSFFLLSEKFTTLEVNKTIPPMNTNIETTQKNYDAEELLLKAYNEISAKLEKNLSLITSKKAFSEKFRSPEFEQDVIQPILEKFGVLSGFYAVANPTLNSLQIINNSEINTNLTNIPYFEIPTVCDGEGYHEHLPKSTLNRWLIDLMFESEKSRAQLIPQKSWKTPYWLQNLPPYQSKHAFPEMPHEQKLRDSEEIDYLFCYTGEVLFFVYAWRWLVKYSQLVGLKERVDLENVGWIKGPVHHINIWEAAYWNNFSDTPEKEWVQYMHRGFKQDESIRLDDQQINILIDYWTKLSYELDNLRPEEKYYFYKAEWHKLGLDKKDPISRNWVQALKSYTRHLLLKLDLKEKSQNLNTPPAVFPNSVDQNIGEDVKIKSWVLQMNHLVDQILATPDPIEKTKLIDELFAVEENDELLQHYLLRKVVFEALCVDLPIAEKESIDVAKLLNILHKRARFPIIPAFFQIYLSKDKTPPEFLAFPVGRSFSYPIEVFLPLEGATREAPEKTNYTAIAVMMLKPIWSLETSHGQSFKFTHADTSTYPPETRKSKEALERLRSIQKLILTASRHMVDTAYYGNTVDRDIRTNTAKQQYYYQAHEMRKIIRFIKAETPGFMLEEIRLYFTILFGSSKFIIDSFLRQGGDLPNNFTLGNSFEELFTNAFSIASRIETISEVGGSGMLDRVSKDDFKFMLEKSKSSLRIHNIKTTNFNFHPGKEETLIDHFHFLCAIICGLRNALQHRRSQSLIEIEVSDNYVSIFNLKKKRLDMPELDETVEDIHPGSTYEALKYYVSMYAGLGTPFFGPKPEDEEKYLTRIPIPH